MKYQVTVILGGFVTTAVASVMTGYALSRKVTGETNPVMRDQLSHNLAGGLAIRQAIMFSVFIAIAYMYGRQTGTKRRITKWFGIAILAICAFDATNDVWAVLAPA